MICDSCHTVIVATIGSQCTFSSQLHWTATNVHIKCACCHLDSIFMWQIECEHNVFCHNADMTMWQIGCITWQLICTSTVSDAIYMLSMWQVFVWTQHVCCHVTVSTMWQIHCTADSIFCVFPWWLVISEHTVAISGCSLDVFHRFFEFCVAF